MRMSGEANAPANLNSFPFPFHFPFSPSLLPALL
jgi:hypothetical protein